MDFLREEFKKKTRDEWVDWFDGKDICFAPVLDLKEAWDHPQVYAREMRLKDADGNDYIGNPIKFTNEPAQVPLDLPELGQHSDEVLMGRPRDAPARSGARCWKSDLEGRTALGAGNY